MEGNPCARCIVKWLLISNNPQKPYGGGTVSLSRQLMRKEPSQRLLFLYTRSHHRQGAHQTQAPSNTKPKAKFIITMRHTSLSCLYFLQCPEPCIRFEDLAGRSLASRKLTGKGLSYKKITPRYHAHTHYRNIVV